MLPECWISSAIATTISSTASNPKKIAATFVDGFAPEMIRYKAPPVSSAVKICQGIVTWR